MEPNERRFGYLVFPNPEGGDDDDHRFGRRVFADHPESADRFRIHYRFRDLETGEVVVEGAATEMKRSIVEITVPDPGPRDHPVKMYPGRITYFLGDDMKVQFVDCVARGLIAYGNEVLTPRERVE